MGVTPKPNIKVMCITDLHIGRSPSVGSHTNVICSPREICQRSIQIAVEQKVDAVLLSGDIFDSQNVALEGYSAIAQPIELLQKEEIPIVAIAGNHDYALLAALQKQIPYLTLLSKDGTWDEILLKRDGSPFLRIQGKSFTQPHDTNNPLTHYSPPTDLIPTFALLHCDVDGGKDSCYAPVTLAELKRFHNLFWVLGHIHKPSILSQNPLVLYPGSPQGLDPSEEGAHGPWIIELQKDTSHNCYQLPIARLRYETINWKINPQLRQEEWDADLLKVLRAWHDNHQSELKHCEFLWYKLRISGESEHLLDLERYLRSLNQREGTEISGTTFALRKVINTVALPLDYQKLSARKDPPGLLAREITILQSKLPPTQIPRDYR